jgi:hypothetical protein
VKYEYAVEMTSGGVIYIPASLTDCSGVQKLLGGDTHSKQGDFTSLLNLKKK